MNKRIKELAERAWLTDCIEQSPEYKKNEMTEYLLQDMEGFHKKFAELLIEQCVTCVKYTDKDMILTAHDAGVVNAAHDRAMKAIRKHFGVEE